MAHKWIQVAGDVDAVVFGGTFVRASKPDSSYCDMYVVFGMDFEETTRTVEVSRWRDPKDYSKGLITYTLTLQAKIEVQRLDIAWADPLQATWVKWDDVLRCSGDKRKPEDIPAWERIKLVGDYYGWANFGEPDYLTEGEIRTGTLRGALKRARIAA